MTKPKGEKNYCDPCDTAIIADPYPVDKRLPKVDWPIVKLRPAPTVPASTQ